jgi:SAM-dependent methyltransferase
MMLSDRLLIMEPNFKPVPHYPPVGLFYSLLFYCRCIVDFQLYTIFKHLKKRLPDYNGKVLDIGCGNSPFKFLIDESKACYTGIDIENADKFDYHNLEKTVFDGENIPYEQESFDNIILTEVLEHIENPEKIISEMYRVLKYGGEAIVTIPWSARVHFEPYDFCRYTPFKLEKLFSDFQDVKIFNRGTDINSVISKLIVIFMRNAAICLKIGSIKGIKHKMFLPFNIVFSIAFFPILLLAIGISHLELLLKLGSENDPLGYTIIAKKHN